MTGEVFQRLVGWVARRPAAVVGFVVVLAVGAAAFAALTLHPTAGTDTLVGRSSSAYQATQRYHRSFGDDAVIVLVRGPLTRLVPTSDILRATALEGGLSGNKPPKGTPPGGPNGPRAHVARLVFDPSKRTGTPKARFAYLFPTPNAALIQVRLKPTLSESERSKAIALVRRAVAMPDWHLNNGGTYVVTGAPVVVNELSSDISSSLIVLLVAALLVMAATLALVFRARLRLPPLGVALLASALTFGALAVAGAPLTMATIGVLPVLLGLAVDYAIQVQSRVGEEGLRAAAARGVPTIATAAAATAAGFLVLALSPVPMVRDFGLLLVVGIVLGLACALTAGVAVPALPRPGRP